ncbi:LAMI_0E09692g1_1 [Lachancea mirantina]|uniref:LAMI_0E09692g1_1 n=1 Tax=Lachancea mirantina TaxID=1230905 RepID=A0A1G4JNU6_9SACH|nr:LAMI_0E09692g1_1 [Lachancea mirantina]
MGILTNISVDKVRFPFSDKISLPQGVLNDLINSSDHDLFDASRPLVITLTLSQDSDDNCIGVQTVGVRDFSLDDPQSVTLPWLVASRFGIHSLGNKRDAFYKLKWQVAHDVKACEKLTLKYVGSKKWGAQDFESVEKSDNYLEKAVSEDVFSMKAFLEARMNNAITCVTQNQRLLVSKAPNGERASEIFEFDVIELDPSPVSIVVNTDLELDLLLEESISGSSTQQTSASNSTKPLALRIGELTTVSEDKQQIYSLKCRKNLLLEISQNDLGESLQIVAGHDSNTLSEDCYDFSTLMSSAKMLRSSVNSSTIVPLPEEGMIFLKPVWFDSNDTATFKFRIKEANEIESQDEIEGKVKCRHCSTLIAAGTYPLHEVHCARSTRICDECGKMYCQVKTIPQEHWHCCKDHQLMAGDMNVSRLRHLEFFHVPIGCDMCSASFESKDDLAKHKHQVCPRRLHSCRFCHLRIERGESSVEARYYGLSGHELNCGIKTTECYRCQKTVKLMELERHMEFHDLKRIERGKSTVIDICKNVNCCRILTNLTNRWGLCSLCYGPFFDTQDDFDGKRFLRKLERKYVIQLTRGCGSTFCKNSECKSSGLVNMGSLKEIITHVQVDLLKEPMEVFSLCVDESTTKRKVFADTFLELQPNEYAPEWVCRGACYLKTLNMDSLMDWLHENAISNAEL